MVAQRPRVAGWYARCQARPSFAEALRKWENQKYLSLMKPRGEQHWPQVHAIMSRLKARIALLRRTATIAAKHDRTGHSMVAFRRLGGAVLIAPGRLRLRAPASAQTYPTQNINVIVAFAAGGIADGLGRLVGQKLGERLGSRW